MGARWPQEEWKPDMAKLEVSVGFDERKCSNQDRFFTGNGFSISYYLLDVFTLFMERKFPKQGRVFSKYCTINFECHFNNFGGDFREEDII